jgi:hypothetical protein
VKVRVTMALLQVEPVPALSAVRAVAEVRAEPERHKDRARARNDRRAQAPVVRVAEE